ncbi:hypothetical protein QVD17_32815 [Tagetes erecta]|uniref:Uncharacterized protein n=1 Tax=Tagetes erecta TaxID=13708 RepID=A0AAD8K081_TARER|nr:hypothetical protein QVD17_32815 [Tagetes erecta]
MFRLAGSLMLLNNFEEQHFTEMAVAGLCKASGLDSHLGNNERSTTRTSSIRKMWRDLENEGRAKENEWRQTSGMVSSPESPCSSSLEGESMECEDTLRGTNEIENECPRRQNQMVVQEKEGVRKVFEEQGSKSFGGHTVYSSSRLNNECKRVRIVREWIESSTQQGDPSRTSGSDESITQTGSQIDGARRPIRRIYGRQALLDLLAKFVRGRKKEVDELLENGFVSNFAHRHRIQSLLKARFLRNQRFVEVEKQTSVAASELGFLRQTHAVSDIRKGFLTRLNNYGHATQSDSDTSSDNEMNNYDRVEQVEEAIEEIPHDIGENFEITNLRNHWESHNPPEFPSAVGEMHDNNILQCEEREKLPFSVDHSPRSDQSDSETSFDNDMTNGHTEQAVGEEFEATNFTSNWESTNQQEHTQSDSDSDTSLDNEMRLDHIEQAEEIVNEIPNASHSPQQSHDDGGWYQEIVGSDFQESHEDEEEEEEEEWYGNDNAVDPTESWFGGNNSYLEAALVNRSNAFYWSDDDVDDNGSRVVELRELTNRRSVSNLLQSDFGSTLDQLMQSYVNRQDQSFESENEWMQDHNQQSSQNENVTDIDASPQTHADHDLHSAADSQFHDSDYHLSNEQEIINSLRIDMETLEQRMNDMQKMLETCMDMQIELQRSVRQEIHSALTRSSTSTGAFEDGVWNYQSKDCFLCCDNESESLPDRSAHMLHICSKCAQKISVFFVQVFPCHSFENISIFICPSPFLLEHS